MAENCVFCRIIKKQTPASIVYEDTQVIAFLSHRPINVGHTLVVPKKHYVDIYDISEDEAAYLFKVTKRMAHAVRDATGAEGIRIVQNNGEAAGQVVFHIHVHIIPMGTRNLNGHDGIYRDPDNPRSVEDLEQDAQKIRHALNLATHG